MKYIYSRDNEDGTWDHNEVRKAYKQGCGVDIGITGRFTPHPEPMFFTCYQYRALVPDTYGIHESSSTLREGGPAAEEMLLDRIKELEHVLTDIIRDHDDPLEPGTTQYFWDQARAALNKEKRNGF